MIRSPEIPVRIGRVGDDAQFQRNIRNSTRSADRFGARMAANGAMVRGFGLALLLAGGAAAGLMKKALAMADSIDKASRAANIGAERLQTLRFAAEQSGISAGRMDTALAKFNVTLGKVSSGMETKSSTVVKAFEALGISVDQVTNSGLSSEQMFDLVTERLAGMENGAEQAAIAAQLFGRSAGPDMRNLLANGVKGMQDLETAMRDGGAVIDQALITRGVEMADKWSSIMTSMSNAAAEFALSAAVSMDNALGFTDTGKIVQAGRAIDTLLIAQRKTRESLKKDNELFVKESQKPNQQVSITGNTQLDFIGGRMQADVKSLAEINDQLNSYRAEIAEFGRAKEERERLLAKLREAPGEIGSGGLPAPASGSGTGTSTDAGSGAAGGGARSVDYERLAERWKSRLELISEKQAEEQAILADARAKNLIDEETYQQRLTQLTKEHADARKNVAQLEAAAKVSTVLGAGSEVLSAMGAYNDKALRAAKIFGAAQAMVSTWQGSAAALKGPFPGNIAAAATVAAKGLAMVGAIRSVSAGGGGGAVGGGGGGTVPQAAAPAPLQVMLNGLSPDNLYSGSSITTLLDRIQDEAGDRGYKLGFPT